MRKTAKRVAVYILIYLIAIIAVVMLKSKTVTAVTSTVSENLTADEFKAVYSEEGVAELTAISVENGKLTATFHEVGQGETDVEILTEEESFVGQFRLKVGKMGIILETSHGAIGAMPYILAITALFFIWMTILMFRIFWDHRHVELYSYKTIYSVGLGLFIASIAVTTTGLFILNALQPETYAGYTITSVLISSEWQFMLISLPFILVYSIALIISNLFLMKHEGKGVRNALGIVAGFFLMAGWFLGFLIYLAMSNYAGSLMQYRLYTLLQGGYCTIYMYFECMLLGAIICSRIAAMSEPEKDRDYIVILGCGIRKDGTLYPLLQGRVDRAVDFYHSQIEKTGKAPILVPSGGQGKDEICSEAEAMENYLLSIGIPKEHILIENKSKTTLQNMAFSKKIIEEQNPEAKAAFSTTNYHVFRSGIWSRRANFHPQGMGAKTKWYFGPNAFMREFAGLLVTEKKRVILCLLLLVAFYVLQVMVAPI